MIRCVRTILALAAPHRAHRHIGHVMRHHSSLRRIVRVTCYVTLGGAAAIGTGAAGGHLIANGPPSLMGAGTSGFTTAANSFPLPQEAAVPAPPVSVPEPSSAALLLPALIGIAALRRRAP